MFSFFIFVAVVLSHEFGHYYVAKKLGYKLSNFVIAPYGVCLNYKEKYFSHKDEILIAIAGPLVNVILSIICTALWWVFPEFYGFSYDFVMQSLMLGLFNLLPCYPLDGGRIFVGAASNFIPRTKAVKAACIINIVIALFLLALFVFSCFINFNPTLCACGVFMILNSIEGKNQCRYSPVDLFNKRVKNYSKPVFLMVDDSQTLANLMKHIEVNKFTIFIVTLNGQKTKLLDEQAVKRLSLAYPLDRPINKILK
ncbi:MAG: site-2 protease family protein [Clostridia bacterium]|nr:site-2 protease family protein [Clostridia bacterium]